jgi:Ca-activated chloride channel family protein
MSVLPVLLLLLQAIITVHTQLVVVPAVVTDARGVLVSGLTQDNFRVFEDGHPVDLVAFHSGDTSMTLGLIVDRSQSMRPKTEALFNVVSRLLLLARPDDELFAVDFNDSVSLALPAAQPFTNIGGGIMTAIAAIPAEGQTALYDGVAEGLLHLQLGRAERHALVVVSDGGDNVSRRKYSEILALAQKSDAVIYAIGLLGSSPDEEYEDAGLLTRLCKDTGGVAYFPKTSSEIASVATQISRDLHEQYTLGFSPAESTGKPRLHAIKVTATAADGSKLRVRARAGYLTQ